jgi:mRNA interferase RelE/StbE
MSEQVDAFLRQLPPGPKHTVRLAISRLAHGDAGIKALKEELAGFRRVAVGKYRVVYLSLTEQVECVHAGVRKTVYKEFKPE